MVDITSQDQLAINNAIWSHPKGVSYTTKINQIAECCQNIGTKRSGVARLWMYEMYAKAIEEDHKKRGLIKEEPIKPPQVELVVSKKPKAKVTRRAARRVEQSTTYPNLPRYAPVFKIEAENAAIISEIDQVLDQINKSPFNHLKPIKPKEVKIDVKPLIVAYEEFVKAKDEKEKKVKKRRKREAEMLLLLAA